MIKQWTRIKIVKNEGRSNYGFEGHFNDVIMDLCIKEINYGREIFKEYRDNFFSHNINAYEVNFDQIFTIENKFFAQRFNSFMYVLRGEDGNIYFNRLKIQFKIV